MKIQYQPINVIRPLAAFAVFLLVAHLVGLLLRYQFGYEFAKGFVPMFNLDHERNVPSFFSSSILLASAVLLTFIATLVRHGENTGKRLNTGVVPWIGLAVMFLYIAYDEAFSVHERSMAPTRELVGASGAFYYAWVIPYGILALTIVAIYLRFVLRLPERIRNLMILSGCLYVGGAIGMEMVAAYYVETIGSKGLPYETFATIEECLEITGVLTFLYTLLRYIEVTFPGLSFGIASAPVPDAHEPESRFVQPAHSAQKL